MGKMRLIVEIKCLSSTRKRRSKEIKYLDHDDGLMVADVVAVSEPRSNNNKQGETGRLITSGLLTS